MFNCHVWLLYQRVYHQPHGFFFCAVADRFLHHRRRWRHWVRRGIHPAVADQGGYGWEPGTDSPPPVQVGPGRCLGPREQVDCYPNLTLVTILRNVSWFYKDIYYINLFNTQNQEHNWLVVWNMNFMVPFSWECHHPNWRSPSFFREVGLNHQPDYCWSWHQPDINWASTLRIEPIWAGLWRPQWPQSSKGQLLLVWWGRHGSSHVRNWWNAGEEHRNTLWNISCYHFLE